MLLLCDSIDDMQQLLGNFIQALKGAFDCLEYLSPILRAAWGSKLLSFCQLYFLSLIWYAASYDF